MRAHNFCSVTQSVEPQRWIAGKPQQLVPVWIGGMPDRIRHIIRDESGRKEVNQYPNTLARNNGCWVDLLDSQIDNSEFDYDGVAVHCVALLEADRVHEAFDDLGYWLEMQRELYAHMTGECNVGNLYFSRIKKVVKLPALRILPTMSTSSTFAPLPSWFVTILMDDVNDRLVCEAQGEYRPLQWLTENDATCVMRIPKAFAAMIANGIMETVAVCEMSAEKRGDVRNPGWSLGWDSKSFRGTPLVQLQNDFQELSRMTWDHPGNFFIRQRESMAVQHLKDLLQSARAAISHIPSREIRDNHTLLHRMENLHNQIAGAQQHVDLSHLPSRGILAHATRKYEVDNLLSAFMAGEFLKSDKQLFDACRWCVQACFPKHMATSIVKTMESDLVTAPSAPTICRTRARVDVAYILFMRKRVEEMFNDGGAVIFAMADKSPQGGREIEQVVLQFVKRSVLAMLQCSIQHMECRLVCMCLCLFVFRHTCCFVARSKVLSGAFFNFIPNKQIQSITV